MKIDNSIKNNPEITSKAIKREYGTLKAIEELIDNCIFYATKEISSINGKFSKK